jgi:hypothetical protein
MMVPFLHFAAHAVRYDASTGRCMQAAGNMGCYRCHLQLISLQRPTEAGASRDGEGFLGMANSFTEQRKSSSWIPFLPLGRWWTHS